MSKLIELVNGSFEQSHYDKTNIDNYPYVAFSNTDNKLLYTHIPNFFYIESLEDDNVIDLSVATWIGQKSSQVQYSLNKRKWFTLPESYTLNKGEKMYFRCVEGNIEKEFENHKPLLNPSKTFNIGGDISTVIYGEENMQTINNNDGVMFRLFYNTKVVDASKLLLPATTLVDNCYHGMFENCVSLTAVPELPATTLAESCYNSMFYGCTSLTTAPKLPVTTLVKNCYSYMFYNCSSLTTVPELPATTLVDSCYGGMFVGCTSLTTAPELPATTLADNCYASMFSCCTSLTTAPELPATTLAAGCYQGMFAECTSLTTVPELPAMTLAYNCYNDMFNGCISLTTAPELPATTLAPYCYNNMFAYCESLATAPELPATTLAPHCYDSMFKNCTSLTAAPELPATTLADYCYQFLFNGCTNLNYIKCLATAVWATNYTSNWVRNVSQTGTFYKHSDATWSTGVNGIPNGWEVGEIEEEDEDL